MERRRLRAVVREKRRPHGSATTAVLMLGAVPSLHARYAHGRVNVPIGVFLLLFIAEGRRAAMGAVTFRRRTRRDEGGIDIAARI
jgi:hypothetical protein